MSIVTYPDGRVFEIADGDRELADYYRGEGATISGDLAAVEFPRVYVEGSDTYVGEEPAPVVDDVVPTLQSVTDALTAAMMPTLYRHVGDDEVDATAWPDSGQVNAAGEKLYAFVGDKAPGDANGASKEWVLDTASSTQGEKPSR